MKLHQFVLQLFIDFQLDIEELIFVYLLKRRRKKKRKVSTQTSLNKSTILTE